MPPATLPSTIKTKGSLASIAFIISFDLSLNTTGRECSECGQIGVKIKAFKSGVKTEPPAASE